MTTVNPPEEMPTPIEEAASVQPTDPRVRGVLPPAQMKAMQALRERARDIIIEIGNVEVRKARLLTHLGNIEGQAESLMKDEAKKLGVPEGADFQITREGVVLADPPSGG